MQRFVCIHGHFYQPPRENPWLDEVEPQLSAYPYHDWNERITAECYAPNAEARILDSEERIVRIVDNYRRMSFNFGPTLLGWLESRHGATYRALLDADRASRERFSGHGSALAQVYGHAILPLANARDKRTQVLWGARDFAQRFGREPEGMWLAETAVDLESLEILAEAGIRFTILAPAQAAAVREIGARDWTDVRGGLVETGRAYRVCLPSGREIAVFFYHAGLSGAVAFGGLLARGDELVRRILDSFPRQARGPWLAHLATDGETFGHHHRFGDMALAYALDALDAGTAARLTNYGEFLELHPPRHEARIVERSAWSCAHGVGRWTDDCGCRAGGRPEWKQTWRRPLREALDWLRDALAPEFARHAAGLVVDPWRARDDYVAIVLDRSPGVIDAFLRRHGGDRIDATRRTLALELFEMQRQALLMYASCGWFFDELSGIETVQVLRHAARAIELAERRFGGAWEQRFLERLARAPSNVPEYGDGRAVWDKLVRPAQAPPEKVAANHAAALLFDDLAQADLSRAFAVEPLELARRRSGRARLVSGTLRVRSRLTLEQHEFEFAFLHLGDHSLAGAVRAAGGGASAAREEIGAAFAGGDGPGALRLVERHFGRTLSLEALFGDLQRRILERLLETTLAEAEAVHQRLYEHHAPLMRYLKTLDSPPPRPLAIAAELVLNSALRRELAAAEPDPQRVRELLDEARDCGLELDRPGLGYAAQSALESIAARFAAEPARVADLERLRLGAAFLREGPLAADLRRVENVYYRLAREVLPGYVEAAARGDSTATQWVRAFDDLGAVLRVRRPAGPDEPGRGRS